MKDLPHGELVAAHQQAEDALMDDPAEPLPAGVYDGIARLEEEARIERIRRALERDR